MDTRLTINKGASFLPILTDCMEQQLPVALLYEDQGITRASGKIKAIFPEDNPTEFELDNGQRILLSAVVAVNGTFLDNYCEC